MTHSRGPSARTILPELFRAEYHDGIESHGA
jgi:hypothetical protein